MQDIPDHVAQRLRFYVYRLIDPRNGETFYVGKGSGERVYQHVRAEKVIDGSDEDALDLKPQRIKDIRAARLEVGHVIHRHGITDQKVALEIEAAVMDAYPGLVNRAGGHSSGDYGCRNINQIIAEYTKPEFHAVEPFILMVRLQRLEPSGAGGVPRSSA